MRRTFALTACLLALTACTADGPDTIYVLPIGEGPIGEAELPIINGQMDNDHPAVVAVLGNQGACTGTIIHTDPATSAGYVLTAAHCPNPIEIRQGVNWVNPDFVYSAVTSSNHPNYTGGDLDFKMVRFTGASQSTPVIPAVGSNDGLSSGTQIRHVGYGKAGPAPGSDNTQRRQTTGQIANVNAITIDYNQPNSGPCSGDSGGPQLTIGANEVVVGVTSYGDQNCNSFGVSGRVSAVYDSFIVPFINNEAPGPLDCDACTQASTSGQGACVPQVNTCLNTPDCEALLQCFNGCGNSQTCLQGCVNDHPSGYNVYLDIFECVCDVGCADECAGEPLCSGGSGSSVASNAASSQQSAASNGSGGGTTASGATNGAGGANSSSGSWTNGNNSDE